MERVNLVSAGGALLPFAAILATAGLFGAAPSAVAASGEWLFLASIVVFGLPHGAVDHIVIARLQGAPLLSGLVLGRLAVYVLAVFATLAAWWLAPAIVFAGFIALTLFHWGQGDNWFQRRLYGASAGLDAVVLAGGLPMLVPLIAFPETYADVAESFVAAAGAEVSLGPAIESLVVPAAILLFAVACVRVVRAGHGRTAVVAETLLLATFFAFVPPVTAIAVYFCLWHAPRHLVRLSELLYGGGWSSLGRTLLVAAPLTLVSVAGLVCLFLAVPTEDLFSTYLALIAALTVPHVVVVTSMDLRAGLSLLR